MTTTFTDPRERGKAFGIYGALAGRRRASGCCSAASSPST